MDMVGIPVTIDRRATADLRQEVVVLEEEEDEEEEEEEEEDVRSVFRRCNLEGGAVA